MEYWRIQHTHTRSHTHTHTRVWLRAASKCCRKEMPTTHAWLSCGAGAGDTMNAQCTRPSPLGLRSGPTEESMAQAMHDLCKWVCRNNMREHICSVELLGTLLQKATPVVAESNPSVANVDVFQRPPLSDDGATSRRRIGQGLDRDPLPLRPSPPACTMAHTSVFADDRATRPCAALVTFAQGPSARCQRIRLRPRESRGGTQSQTPAHRRGAV